MGKLFIQFLVLAGLFFLIWAGLSRINFTKLLHLQQISRKTENKIGDIIISGLEKTSKVIDDDSTVMVLNKIKNRLCTNNAIVPSEIKIHLIENEQINAFAIPGHHIIVYTGLIKHCDSATELCGVLSHEMAHIQLSHVMSRLVSELGIAMLVSIASNGNSQVVGKMIQVLSSSAFERKQETAADAAGVQYLHNAHINPKGFADFMLKVAAIQAGTPKELEWISSHPDSKKRATAILSLIDKNPYSYEPVLEQEQWQQLKNTASGSTAAVY